MRHTGLTVAIRTESTSNLVGSVRGPVKSAGGQFSSGVGAILLPNPRPTLAARRAQRYGQRVITWLRGHAHLSDLVVVGIAVAMSVSLADELGIATALALGAGLIVITNVLLGLGSPHD
jgi:hypothetical protein